MTALYEVFGGQDAKARDINQYRDLFRGSSVYDVKNGYGATGDGVTDDLAAFDAATSACASAGGGIIYVPSGNYYLSDEWVIDMERVHVECAPDATIWTDGATTTGGTIEAVGHMGLGLATTPQREWFSWRGGIVYNKNNGTADNGIGIVRYKNARVEGVRFLNPSGGTAVGRKAVTAQYGVDNVYFTDNVIGAAGLRAITIETACDNVYIRGNTITSSADATGAAIHCATTITNLFIEDNVILGAAGDGINANGATDCVIARNIIKSPGRNGIQAYLSENVTVEGNTITLAGYHGVYLNTCSGMLNVRGNFVDRAGQGTANTYDAIIANACTSRPTIIGNVVAGTSHRYALNCVSMSGYQAVSTGNQFLTGATGVYGNWLPALAEDIVDGIPVRIAYGTGAGVMIHVVQGTAAPASGTWLRGDICWNTTPSAAGVPGWVCTTAGTPGTWKAMAVVAA